MTSMDAPDPNLGGGAGGGTRGFGFPGASIFGRLSEKILGWIALGLLILAGYGVYKLGPDGRGAILSATGLIIGWIAIVAALPWFSRLFMRRLLQIGENWVGLALIAAFTIIDIAAGLALLRGWPEGFWGWFISLAAVGIAATYNYLVAEYVAERYGGL